MNARVSFRRVWLLARSRTMSCPRTVCRACGLPPEDMRMIPNSPLRRQIDSLYIGVENAIWAKKPCREAKDSFHELKRKSATMHSQTCMVGLRNFHGSASQLAWLDFATSMVQLRNFHGSAFACPFIGSKSGFSGLLFVTKKGFVYDQKGFGSNHNKVLA